MNESKRRIFELLKYEPTLLQEKIHDDDSRLKQVVGGERAGKALWVGTPIPTLSGWKTMGQIGVGDTVFSDSGKPVPVTWVSGIEADRDCYRITFDNGEEIIADGDHLWGVQTEHDRKAEEIKVMPSPEIGKHRILDTYNLTIDTLLERPAASGWLANYSVTVAGVIAYPERMLPVDPYVLGVWLGDGTARAGEITTRDTEIAERIEQLGYNIYKASGLVTQLRGLNLIQNKHIPSLYLGASAEQRMELLKGLMDTAGGATRKGNEFYSKNEVLIDNMRLLLASLGIKSWKRAKIARLHGKDYGIAYTVSFCAPFPVFTLERKIARQNLTPTGHTRSHYIMSVEPVRSVPVKCIGVDSDNALYLITHSYIPTHNSLVNSKEFAWRYFGETLPSQRAGLFWLLGNDYEATRGEWEHISNDMMRLEILAAPPTKNIDPGEIVLQDGTRIVTKSAKYPEKIATTAPDGIMICEAAQIDYEVFLRAYSRTAEKRGWLCMAGTFEEDDYTGWYREMFQLGRGLNDMGLKSFSLPTWSNTKVFPGGREDPEILRQENVMTHERFMERFGGEPSPRTGRVIPDFSNPVHVRDCPFDPKVGVELAVDPGYAGAYAVLATQNMGEYIALIDEVYVQGVVTQDIILMCKKRAWWDGVIGGAIDIAAKQHQAMPAPIELWLHEGVSLLHSPVGIEDGIDLLRTHLRPHPITGQPGVIVDPKCRGFIAECGGGKSPVDGGGVWMRDKHTSQPINKWDHATKALIYLLKAKYGHKIERKPLPRFFWVHKQRQPTFVRT